MHCELITVDNVLQTWMLTDATRTCGELISVQFLMFADYFSLVYFILTYGVRYKMQQQMRRGLYVIFL